MKSVGIKSLKNSLSRYLKLVQQGERILVTDRDNVIAEIIKPILHVPGQVSRWESFLNNLERSGDIIRARRKQSKVMEYFKKHPKKESIDSLKILQDLRKDRF